MYGIFMECWVSFKLYFGNPLQALLLVAAAIYITVFEKNMKKKLLLGILPLLVLAGFLLPVTKMLYVAAFDDGSDTYYRLLWLIPSYVVVGYALCKFAFDLGSRAKQRIALVCSLAVIVLSGSLVYINRYMSVAENFYHIPQNVIDICDVIAPQEGEPRVRAAFPSELVHFVRQYDTNILMPYGREMLATQWDYYNEVYEVMEKPETIDADLLLEATRKTGCSYIILAQNRKIDKNLEGCGLKIVGVVDKYNIYADPEVMSQG